MKDAAPAKLVATNASTLDFVGKCQSRDNKATVTIGDLIVELTDDARRFVHDEKELYEVVAYLLETRLHKRGCRSHENGDDREKHYTRKY